MPPKKKVIIISEEKDMDKIIEKINSFLISQSLTPLECLGILDVCKAIVMEGLWQEET